LTTVDIALRGQSQIRFDLGHCPKNPQGSSPLTQFRAAADGADFLAVTLFEEREKGNIRKEDAIEKKII